jgi:hypothetical protein
MTQQLWFSTKDITPIKETPLILIDDVCGYVLPHAGTKYTGDIIRHTLRFQPSNLDRIRSVYIYYYPANEEPDVNIIGGKIRDTDEQILLASISTNKCHHELYVPFRSIIQYFRYWRVNIDQISFIPVNVRSSGSGSVSVSGGHKTVRRENNPRATRHRTRNFQMGGKIHNNTNGCFYIISADFSHHKPFQYAIMNENKAAHAIVSDSLTSSVSARTAPYVNEIDDAYTFREFTRKHKNLSFQWIGRTRSPGERAVGYLSFLIRPRFQPNKQTRKQRIDGIFVTCYDSEMNARECLGKWYGSNDEEWNQSGEDIFIREVVDKARNTSRLTGGKYTNIPVRRCVVTYLFTDTASPTFIRGWHSIRTNAIYLPDVLLEHAKEDGRWITPIDTEWELSDEYKKHNVFDLTETLTELDEKAGVLSSNNINNINGSNIRRYTVRTRVKKIRM